MTEMIWDSMSHEKFEALMLERGDPRMKYSPRLMDNGTVVVPGQIKSTAARNRMKDIVGFGELGADGWATRYGRTKEEKVQEAILRYQISDLSGGR